MGSQGEQGGSAKLEGRYRGLERRSPGTEASANRYGHFMGRRLWRLPDRRTTIDGPMNRILIGIVISLTMFFGAGIYAVYDGQKENNQICEAVYGLRSDLVTSITTLRNRSIDRRPHREEEIREAYEPLLSQINDRQCP